MKSIFDYPKIIESLTDAFFLNIESYDDELYRAFFVKRVEDAEFLYSRLSEVEFFGGNVLVVGEPGIGKSNFLQWFLKSSEFAKQHSPNSFTILDTRPVPYVENTHELFISELKGRVANIMQKHLAVLGDPCNDIPPDDNTSDSRHARYNYCASKVEGIEIKVTDPTKQVHYLFLDDVDYLPANCFSEILENLKPILLSRHFCVIVACRVPAFNALQSHCDFNISRAFDDAKTLRLDPLPVHKILEARIAMLTQGKQSVREALTICPQQGTLAPFFQMLAKLLSQLNPNDDIQLFKYPFTSKQHAFMRMMTNGNIRQVLKMAQEYLRYMRTHRGEIKKMPAGYWVGRQAVIKHFTEEIVEPKIRIHNLHGKKTFQYTSQAELSRKKIPSYRVGNSTQILVLETCKLFQYPNRLDSQYMETLHNEYGLTTTAFQEGISELVNRELIRERFLSARLPLGSRATSKDYDLTEKGDCYLNYLIHWDEYINKFGISNHHRKFRTHDTKMAISAALLQFLINIVATRQSVSKELATADFKIAKQPFRDQFCKINRMLLRHLDPTDRFSIPELTEDAISYYLASWLQVIETHALSDFKNYLFRTQSILKLAEERYLPIELKDIYDVRAFRKFVTTFAREPEYERAEE